MLISMLNGLTFCSFVYVSLKKHEILYSLVQVVHFPDKIPPGYTTQDNLYYSNQLSHSGLLCNAMAASKFGQFSSCNLRSFTFNDLKNATRNFRFDSLLGEGGFGFVFKGWIDEQTFTPCKPGTGMVVAVKKLKSESYQGHREWLVCS